ncbi:MAG TPA: hypothetical protein V6C65_31240 [Allocoleopsis sp.]
MTGTKMGLRVPKWGQYALTQRRQPFEDGTRYGRICQSLKRQPEWGLPYKIEHPLV